MIRESPAPDAFAASTYSFSRSERKTPRTTRAIPVQKKSARMNETRHWLPCAEERRRGEQDREERQRQDEIGEAHQDVVEQAAVVAGDRADDEPDDRRDDGDEDADLLRGADAVDARG